MKSIMKSTIALIIGLGVSVTAFASGKNDFLVKIEGGSQMNLIKFVSTMPANTKVDQLGKIGWYHVTVPANSLMSLQSLKAKPGVVAAQPNYSIKLELPGIEAARAAVVKAGALGSCPIPGLCGEKAQEDNPDLPTTKSAPGTGSDPLFSSQWGMMDIGVRNAWNKTKGDPNVIVAVIDTGVDYTHEDLVDNLWRNPGEDGTDANGNPKWTNGIDDDGNGYIDDLIGWDAVGNDNKPFDLAKSGLDLLTGGNPGHGTHCAGNIAARGFNGKGVSGVAPNVSIMAMRFLSEKGEGDIAGAVKAITYAVDNGARVLSNSWGSEGTDPKDPADQALRDAISYAEQKGAIFIAAAGNGHQGVGYDNDSDAKPGYPASYDLDVIVSVAAVDAQDGLGAFSNWGKNTVDIGAPGVKVFSTTVGSNYSDTVINLPMLGIVANWDGTSMATPHVSGAAALYLSQHPDASWREVKEALIRSAKPIASLNGKSVSNGKLDVDALLSF